MFGFTDNLATQLWRTPLEAYSVLDDSGKHTHTVNTHTHTPPYQIPGRPHCAQLVATGAVGALLKGNSTAAGEEEESVSAHFSHHDLSAALLFKEATLHS